MIRRQQIDPDVMQTVAGGEEIPVVSRAALIQALVDAATMVDVAGGTLTLVTYRTATGLPGEMVTTAAVWEWKDRTDAKAQPETDVREARAPMTDAEVQALIEAAAPTPLDEDFGHDEGLPEEHAGLQAEDEPIDELDLVQLPEEDDSSIPADLR